MKYIHIIYNKLSNPKLYPIHLVIWTLISSLILYIPFLGDLTVIPKYWDGPNYLLIAKTLYDIPFDHPFREYYHTTPAYFACHLPLYPLMIRLVSFMTYPVAMIFVTLLFSCLTTLVFYYFLKELNCVHNPFFSAALSVILPARWLIYHSIGASEPLFAFLAISSLYCFHKKKYWGAFILASLSCVSRITGLLFCCVYFVLLVERKDYKWMFALAIIPLSVFATFLFYQYQFHDFLAYFHWNAKLIHHLPAEALHEFAIAGETNSAEFYLSIYLILGLGSMLLWDYPILFTYCIIFFFFNLFIFHQDISRYFLSITHFAIIVAYDRIFKTWQFKLAILFFIPLLYIYAWGVIPNNLVDNLVYSKLMLLLFQH